MSSRAGFAQIEIAQIEAEFVEQVAQPPFQLAAQIIG